MAPSRRSYPSDAHETSSAATDPLWGEDKESRVELDGPVVRWVTVLLAVMGVVASAVLLPRTRRTLGGLVTRLATQLGVAVLALLVAGVLLNDQYGFYASWSDLLGQGGPQQVTTSGAGVGSALGGRVVTGGTLGPAAVAGAREAPLPPLPDPGQRVQHFTVHGPRSGLTGTVLVSLPASYAAPGDATRTYPVVEAFQGYPGNPTTWVDGPGLVPTLDALSRTGQASEAIVASPQVEFPAGRDTECVDGGVGRPQVETWISEDVPHFLATHLRVRRGRASWATVGFSFGGWCAALTTMLHPGVFGSAIVLAGYFAPDFDPTYRPLAPSSSAARRLDLVALAANAPPPVALWVYTSRADGLSYPSSHAFLRAARSPMSVTSVVSPDAGHRMAVWLAVLPAALRWLTSTPGFVA